MGTDVTAVGRHRIDPDAECQWCGHTLEEHHADEWHCLATGHGPDACRCWAWTPGPEEQAEDRYRIEWSAHRQCTDCYAP